MAFSVFAVNDEPMIRDSLASVLNANSAALADLSLEVFASAEDCARRLAVCGADLLLLDVMLPGMDGYEFCRQLKSETPEVPVIFISSHESIEARLKGYDAGGDDFVVKPFEPEELLRKLRVAQSSIAARARLKEAAAAAEQLSDLALASMDESGLVLQFMSKLIAWEHEQEIAAGLLELMGRYGIEGVVRCRVGRRTHTLSARGIDVPLEQSIIEHVQTMGRIFEFHRRGVYNFERITLIVNNMPIADPDLSGRIRDNLAMAAQATDSRLASIETAEANQHKQQVIHQALDGLSTTLVSLRQAQQGRGLRLSQLILKLDEELAKAFVHLGLSDAQERRIEELTKRFMNQLGEYRDEDMALIDTVDAISRQLAELGQRRTQPA